MKLPIRAAALALLLGASAAAWAVDAPVEASLLVEGGAIRPGEYFTAEVLLEVAEGWHVYGPETGDTGLPTKVEWVLPPGFEAETTRYPPLVRFMQDGVESYGMGGRVLLSARIRAPESLTPGAEVAIGAKASWLACSASCVPGKAELRRVLAVAGAAGARPVGGLGLGLAILLAFLGGIVLNFMPCVLPVLSLKVTSLVKGAAGGSEGEATARALAYGAGVIASFWAFAALLAGLRAAGRSAGWGSQFQDPRVVAATALAFFLVSLNLFGVFEVGTRLAGAAAGAGSSAARRGRGLAGAFASGLFATAAATPCTAPFMGAALGWALSRGAAESFAVFTALGIGMALPFVALASRPALSRLLPPPGRWMESLRQAMGFPMLGAALWMAWIMAASAGPAAAFRLLAALLACGLGAWIWGRWGSPAGERRARIAAAIAAAALAIGGGAAAIASGAATGAGAAAKAGVAQRADSVAQRVDDVAPRAVAEGWEPWSRARVAELAAEGRPAFVSFSAEWCLSCKLNEAVLRSPRVEARFRELGVALLEADWTARSDEIARELGAHGRAGVPLYLIYAPGGSPPRVLPELLTEGIVLEALGRLEAPAPKTAP